MLTYIPHKFKDKWPFESFTLNYVITVTFCCPKGMLTSRDYNFLKVIQGMINEFIIYLDPYNYASNASYFFKAN